MTAATDDRALDRAGDPGSAGRALVVAIGPWILSRALVAAALATARHVADTAFAGRPPTIDHGLLAWDAAWYGDIAKFGYEGVDPAGLRFFPLLPLLGRAVGAIVPGIDAGKGVVVVANLAALWFLVKLHRFVVRESGDADTARRAVWIGVLAPPAFVLVMGYAESVLLLAAVGAIDATRRGRPWRALPWAIVAGLARPTGILVAIPLLVEVFERWRPARPRDRLAGLAAAAGAPIGQLVFLVWARERAGSLFEPLRIHNRTTLRGGVVNPLGAMWDALSDLRLGDRFGSGLHFFTAIVLLSLLVHIWRRGPRSMFWYALASSVIGLSAANLDSIERYAFATLPFIVAGATLTERPMVERYVLVLSGTGLVAMSMLAFFGTLVP